MRDKSEQRAALHRTGRSVRRRTRHPPAAPVVDDEPPFDPYYDVPPAEDDYHALPWMLR